MDGRVVSSPTAHTEQLALLDEICSQLKDLVGEGTSIRDDEARMRKLRNAIRVASKGVLSQLTQNPLSKKRRRSQGDEPSIQKILRMFETALRLLLSDQALPVLFGNDASESLLGPTAGKVGFNGSSPHVLADHLIEAVLSICAYGPDYLRPEVKTLMEVFDLMCEAALHAQTPDATVRSTSNIDSYFRSAYSIYAALNSFSY